MICTYNIVLYNVVQDFMYFKIFMNITEEIRKTNLFLFLIMHYNILSWILLYVTKYILCNVA